jgi:hypothetical protein
MKTKSTIWIVFTFTILLTTNCTIEKRLFQPGYSIEWKKKIPQRDEAKTANHLSDNKIEADSIIINPSSTTISFNNEKLKPEPISIFALHESAVEQTASIENFPALKSDQKEKPEMVSDTPQKKEIELVETKKELELFGVMSFGLYFCSVTFAILAVFVFNLSAYLFVVAGFMILLSIIFGIISVDKYRRNKSKYYRNFFGYFGLIASVVTISLVIGFLILASELGSF